MFRYLEPGCAMKLKLLSILTIVAVIPACMHTRATIVDPGLNLARVCPQAVRLYITPDRITAPYREVAILHFVGSALPTLQELKSSTEQNMVRSMREKSAKLGANGIILTHFDEPDADLTIINASRKTVSEPPGRALAVYIAADSAYSASVCSRKK